MPLLIVESPTKVGKIQGFLGSAWDVGASAGHIRDMPKELGVNRSDGSYALSYVINPDKHELVQRLLDKVKRAGRDQVWLATDPDREGEAIAWHLCQVLGLDPATTKRVTFTEITETAVKQALAQPRTLDLQLVAAQEARRGIDRVFGWEVSPALIDSQHGQPSDPKAPAYSAGRVQSVAARLVVELEEIIENFAAGSGLSFPLSAVFTTPAGEGLPARFIGEAPATEMEARASVLSLTAAGPWSVLSVEQSPVETTPPPPYSTSTLQQDGVRKLKYNVKQVADLAQKLFEEGHITYIRTDSQNIGEEGQAQALAQISGQYGAAYACPRRFKEKDGVQGGHEAIRPTHWDVTDAGNTPQEKALYKLIYTRTLASQMSAARYAQTVIVVGTPAGEAGPRFRSSVRVLEFAGYRAAYEEAEEEAPAAGEEAAEGAEGATLRTPLQPGQALALGRVQAAGRVQKPPKRYDQATLVADLEKRQIGRPSTYSNIINTIFFRQYVREATVAGKKVETKLLSWTAGQPAGHIEEKKRTETLGGDKNKLVPTERGRRATAFLRQHFPELVDFGFTIGCEKQLDAIADGQATYQQLLHGFDQLVLRQKQEAAKANPRTRHVGDYEGQAVTAGTTKFGPAVRWSPKPDEKPLVFSLPADVKPESVTLDQAIEVIKRGLETKKRLVGRHDNKVIEGGISQKSNKAYLLWNDQFFNLPEGAALDTLTPEQARLAVVAQLEAKAKLLFRQIDAKYSIVRSEADAAVLILTDGTTRCKLTKVSEAEAMTWDADKAKQKLADFKKWLANQRAKEASGTAVARK